MKRQRITRTPDEILSYLNDYFNSGIKSPRKYATSVGLPPTTFYQWLDKYQKNLETNSETTEMIPVVRTVPPKFYDITNEANESSLAKLNNSQNIGLIKLSINEMKLEFDVSNIKMVLEALKW